MPSLSGVQPKEDTSGAVVPVAPLSVISTPAPPRQMDGRDMIRRDVVVVLEREPFVGTLTGNEKWLLESEQS